MKLYKNLVDSVAKSLHEIILNHKYTDKVLERLFKQHPQWGSRDRRFVAECTYDCVRYHRFYYSIIESEKNFWLQIAVWLVLKGIELPDWQEFRHIDPQFVLKRYQHLKSEKRISESYPDWLWELGETELGSEKWQEEAKAMNEPAMVILRTNTFKTDVNQLASKFHELGIETERVDGLNNALVLKKRRNVFTTELFKKGYFEVQDAGSQFISDFFELSGNETIIDACAGAGGKSLDLAARLKNKGKIISMDVEAWKLEELKRRAKRAGAFNIETSLIEGDQSIEKMNGKATKLLLDVPCSGIGVVKRNPDAKWKLTPQVISQTKTLQRTILEKYCGMVKANGELLYSTCSIFPSENEKQIKDFLEHHPEFKFVKQKTILPSRGFDGFYMCLLKKQVIE